MEICIKYGFSFWYLLTESIWSLLRMKELVSWQYSSRILHSMEMIHIMTLICCVEVLEFLTMGNRVWFPSQVAIMAEERRACREQEYKDQFGNCIACRQCDAGQELSKVWHVLLWFLSCPFHEDNSVICQNYLFAYWRGFKLYLD